MTRFEPTTPRPLRPDPERSFDLGDPEAYQPRSSFRCPIRLNIDGEWQNCGGRAVTLVGEPPRCATHAAAILDVMPDDGCRVCGSAESAPVHRPAETCCDCHAPAEHHDFINPA
jgi:hypothetical protein